MSRGEMPFLDHLEEFRWRIFKAAAALFIGAGVGLWLVFEFDVLTILVAPAVPYLPDGRLTALAPMTTFIFTLKTGFLLGFVFAFPVILYQVWAFLSPALEKREKRLVVPSLYLGLALFGLGVDLAYRFALPLSLTFLAGLQTEVILTQWTADYYLSFVVRMLVAFGLIFEIPVVTLILSTLGIVTPKFLRSKRRHAIVLITVLASLLSPGDLLIMTVLMMVPLIFLYEFSILLSVLVYRQKRIEEEKYSIHNPERATPPEGTVTRDDDDDDDPDPSGSGPGGGAPVPVADPPAPSGVGAAPTHDEAELSPYGPYDEGGIERPHAPIDPDRPDAPFELPDEPAAEGDSDEEDRAGVDDSMKSTDPSGEPGADPRR